MKISIKEEQQSRLKLAPFIYKAIMSKRTSLGDNPALPPYGDFGFEYDIIKKKYEDVDNSINKYIESGELESKDPDYLVSVLSKKIEECKKLEEPIRPQLQKLCENIVNSTFSVPAETVIVKCNLVGKIKPKKSMRILPEDGDENNSYDFEDVDEVNLTNKVILKRRFINSLIQGVSYWLSTDIDDWCDTVCGLNDEIWNLWYRIKQISDYLLFVKEEKISEKNPMQMSYVEVTLGKNGKKTIIDAQGIIFPYLLRETFRGFLELFSSHGLPKDNQKAMYIIRKADFIVAEPWDLRFGMGIIDMLHDNLTKKYHTGLLFHTNRIPYFFTELCKLKTDEFNDVMQNFLLGTKKGRMIANEIDASIVHDEEYQKFKDKIQQKNIDKSLISDGDFSKEELNDYVIQENETDEMMAYHGSCSDFDKFNHKKYLNTGAGSQAFGWGTYITDDKKIANQYAELEDVSFMQNFMQNINGASNSNKGYVYEVDIPDDDGFNYIAWDEKLTDMQTDMIYSAMETFDKKHNTEMFDDFINQTPSIYDIDGQELYTEITNCFYRHFESVNSNADAQKAASLFLLQCGFDGIKYEAGTVWGKPYGSSEDSLNYVIFDANKVKIVNKTKV